MRITSKGQVTIPRHIREKLGLLPDCEVEFEVTDKGALIRRARESQSPGEKFIERFRGRSDVKMSTDEIMKLTRG